MQLRMPSLGTRNSVAFMKAVEPQLRERFPTPPGGIKTQINGIDILLSDVIEALGVQLYIGFAFAALVITLVMSLVYSSWRVGLASMMPNIYRYFRHWYFGSDRPKSISMLSLWSRLRSE